MKKLLSVILAAVLLTSSLVVGSVSAAAEITQQPVYLLGDVDRKGEVTILDATLIQRSLADLETFDTIQEYQADVDSDDEVTILDATDIQRRLASLSENENIGKALNEVYKTKAIPVLRESIDSTEKTNVRFYADQPHVPYINVADFYNTFYLIGTDLKEGMTADHEGDSYTLTNIAGTTATFDIEKDTIYTPNFESFTKLAYNLQVEATGGVDNNYPFIKLTDTNEPADPAPLTLDLGEYGIDLRGDDTGVYAPVATISDIFATTETYYVVYAGEKIYTNEYAKSLQPTSVMNSDPDYLNAIVADHPADVADFTYRELCFNLDTWYGQPGQEWVHEDLKTKKIDEILTEKYPEIKANLQSRDCLSYFTGLFHLLNGLLFDGGHTTIPSILTNDPALMEVVINSLLTTEYYGKYVYSIVGKTKESTVRVAARNAAYGDDYYIEKGDTAMIHFDSFIVDYNGWKKFYSGEGERPLTFETPNGTTYDTVGVVLSGLERAKKNPEIKNIIIDMSCNSGGDSGAMMAIEWLMKGQGYVKFTSRLTGRTKTTAAQFDMNFDGKFDENDVSPYTDYNYGVLTSSYAFSCGNAYPWYMHEHGSMILGQKTSGGACAIRFTSAAGIEFACSSASSKIVSDSGESVDFGCPIDVDLISEGENPYENFYDLDVLSAKMNEYFGS